MCSGGRYDNLYYYLSNKDIPTFIFEFDRNLHSLFLQKNFDKVKGIVIGRNQINSNLLNKELIKLLKSKEKLANISIIINMDFGHTRPLFTILIGCKCKINNSDATIIQE
ncbi:MAG: microcin C7 resistance protein MccF-like protein [Bacilli bacterium]|nr:microcin C7 resistance protein MccF-like protein [Bacilli bacterium]